MSSMSAVASGSDSAAGTHRFSHARRWLRHDQPVLPFLWRGLLPLLGLAALLLLAVGPFARDAIEARVQQGVLAALGAAGQPWAQVAVSGQDVVLSGTQPQAGTGDAALAIARAATCATWAGPKLCAVSVRGDFGAPPAAAAPAAAAPASAAAAQACEKSLAALLAQRRIEFASGSAKLLPSSAGLLDELAKASRACPGVIRIEGHTDGVGAADMNRTLSQARAEAVRAALVQRGLAANRLAAQGFGPDQPIGDNTTPDGRAQNRRIEFKVTLP